MLNHTGIHLPITLRFVESDERYSLYTAADGEEFFLAHGTGQRLVDFDDLDLGEIWDAWTTTSRRYHLIAFRDLVREMLVNPDEADDFMFCDDCQAPGVEDDMCSVHNGTVCEDCSDQYHWCGDCEELYPDTTTTLNETEVCERCRSQNWTYCEDCDGYRRDNDGDHYHEEEGQGDGCCESPQHRFRIRNDGHDMLANDTRTTVTLPAGIISDEGLGSISKAIRVAAHDTSYTDEQIQNFYTLSYRLAEIGNQWQAKSGNYTKRLSRLAYKEFGLKITPTLLSEVGNIASAHSTAIDFSVEVTRDLNLSAAHFGHSESCWWQSYYASRCTLKSNGGFGIRTFGEQRDVTGRAWVIPLKRDDNNQLTPTFDTEEPVAFVVFNGYGTLDGYTPARILSHMAGMTYRKVEFTAGDMYINGDAGYLIAPEETASKYTDGCLSFDLAQHSDLVYTERIHANA